MTRPQHTDQSAHRVLITALLAAALIVVLTVSSAGAQQRGEVSTGQQQDTDTAAPSAFKLLYDFGQLLQKGRERERQSATTETQRLLVRQKIKQSALNYPRLAVLMPDHYVRAGRLELFAKRNFYTFNQYLDKVHVEMFGTRLKPTKRKRPIKVRALRSDTGEKYLIQRTDFSVDLSFTRYGATYNISILCDNPATDNRCRKDDFIKGLYKKMLMAGGNL